MNPSICTNETFRPFVTKTSHNFSHLLLCLYSHKETLPQRITGTILRNPLKVPWGDRFSPLGGPYWSLGGTVSVPPRDFLVIHYVKS